MINTYVKVLWHKLSNSSKASVPEHDQSYDTNGGEGDLDKLFDKIVAQKSWFLVDDSGDGKPVDAEHNDKSEHGVMVMRELAGIIVAAHGSGKG